MGFILFTCKQSWRPSWSCLCPPFKLKFCPLTIIRRTATCNWTGWDGWKHHGRPFFTQFAGISTHFPGKYFNLVIIFSHCWCFYKFWTNVIDNYFESYHPFKTISIIIEVQILVLCFQFAYFNSLKANVKFHLRNYYNHNLHKHTFLWSLKGTFYLNFMRYHGVSIENTYCY